MAHEIVFDETRQINPVAFVGETPWHGLGQRLEPGQPLEVWAKQAGMDFEIDTAPVLYLDGDDLLRSFPNRNILRRNDTQLPLSIVSDQYRVVQPAEILEFFRSLIDTAGFRMNTAGVLFGGKRYWALAEIGESARIRGQDRLDGFLLLATAVDGTLATTAAFTSVRVVCNNTLSFAVNRLDSGEESTPYLKVSHNKAFDSESVKGELGLAKKSWDTFIDSAKELSTRTVSDREAVEWLIRVFGKVEEGEDITDEIIKASDAKVIKNVLSLYQGGGKGSNLKSSEGTAWGLVNAVTEWGDFHRNTKTQDNRFDSGQFGTVANIKKRAWDEALKLVA